MAETEESTTEKPKFSPRTVGLAEWLKLDLSDCPTEAHAQQKINNAAPPDDYYELAKELGKDIEGLTYGTAEPVIRRAKAKANKEIVEQRGWKVGTTLRLEGTLWIVVDASPAKMVLKGLGKPRVAMEGRSPNRRATGLKWPLSKTSKTKPAFDLRKAETVDPVALILY